MQPLIKVRNTNASMEKMLRFQTLGYLFGIQGLGTRKRSRLPVFEINLWPCKWEGEQGRSRRRSHLFYVQILREKDQGLAKIFSVTLTFIVDLDLVPLLEEQLSMQTYWMKSLIEFKVVSEKIKDNFKRTL